MWGNTLLAATPALAHRAFISAQICLREMGLPLRVRKISPEAVFCFLAYCSSFFRSLWGMRMVRIFPFRETSARPARAASTVRYCTSLTRMPVEQMASISRPRRSCLSLPATASSRAYSSRVSSRLSSRNICRCTRSAFTRQSSQPKNLNSWFSGTSMAFTVPGR